MVCRQWGCPIGSLHGIGPWSKNAPGRWQEKIMAHSCPWVVSGIAENHHELGEISNVIKYLHVMVRVLDLEKSMAFYSLLGLVETRRTTNEQGRFTLVFMAPPDQPECPVELTYNWDGDEGLPSDSRHFGHLAYEVDDIYATCAMLQENGIVINRPPRDGRMAFVRSPDNVSIELLQKDGARQIEEPWASMENVGHW